MQTVRHLALHRELALIEATAAAHVQAITNRAADLEVAYDLCFAVSVGLPFHTAFHPTVVYDDEGGCEIDVMTYERGAEFLARAKAAGLSWAEANAYGGVLRDIVFNGYPRVHVLVHYSELAAHCAAASAKRAA